MSNMFIPLTKQQHKERMQRLNGEIEKVVVERIHKNIKSKKNKSRLEKKKPYIPYWEQLNTKQWEQKRKEVFKLKGERCSKCGSTKSLQIHHTQYLPNKYAWEYKMKYYIVLCERCHKKQHCIDLDEELDHILGI